MVSRHKDCIAYTALGQILVATGLPIDHLFRWVLVRPVAREAVEMMRDTEEMEMEFLYSAYLSDLRLVSKSPYSAAANPSGRCRGCTLLGRRCTIHGVSSRSPQMAWCTGFQVYRMRSVKAAFCHANLARCASMIIHLHMSRPRLTLHNVQANSCHHSQSLSSNPGN